MLTDFVVGRTGIGLSRSLPQLDAKPANPCMALVLFRMAPVMLRQAQAERKDHGRWANCASRHLQASEKESWDTILAAYGMESASFGLAV